MAKAAGFICRDEYLDKLGKLTDEEFGRLFRALMVYHRDGDRQELSGREDIAFDFIKDDIDRDDEKYISKCETNRNNRQRAATTDNDRQRPSTPVTNINVNIKEKEIDEDDDTARVRETAFGEVEADPVILAVQSELNGLTVSHYDDLASFRQDLPDDLVIEAVNEAVAHGARTWAYVRTILQGYIKDHVRTVGEARQRAERRKRDSTRSQPASQRPAQDYTQRSYTEAELEARINEL